jgi:hypothetical protein
VSIKLDIATSQKTALFNTELPVWEVEYRFLASLFVLGLYRYALQTQDNRELASSDDDWYAWVSRRQFDFRKVSYTFSFGS